MIINYIIDQIINLRLALVLHHPAQPSSFKAEETGRAGEARRPAAFWGWRAWKRSQWAVKISPYRCSIKGRLSSQIAVTRSTPRIQVNKLIGDLRKQFLQQGSNKVILAFSLPFSIVSVKKALENVNLMCVTLRGSEHSNPDHWL